MVLKVPARCVLLRPFDEASTKYFFQYFFFCCCFFTSEAPTGLKLVFLQGTLTRDLIQTGVTERLKVAVASTKVNVVCLPEMAEDPQPRLPCMDLQYECKKKIQLKDIDYRLIV